MRARIRVGERPRRERGAGIVEFAVVLPLFLMLMLIPIEFGFGFNDFLTLGQATREGARTGSGLAAAGVASCAGGQDPEGVDEQIIAAVQRVLKSPGSDVRLADIGEIRIFKSSASGTQLGSAANVWTYTPGAGPDVDPGAGTDILDFSPRSVGWPACSRINRGTPDSIGVTIVYAYRLRTPLESVVSLAFGPLSNRIDITERTVMALNPSE